MTREDDDLSAGVGLPPEVGRVIDRHPFKRAEGGPVPSGTQFEVYPGDTFVPIPPPGPAEYFRPFPPPGWTKIAEGPGVRVVDADGDVLAEGGVVYWAEVDLGTKLNKNLLTVRSEPLSQAEVDEAVRGIRSAPALWLPDSYEYPRLGDRVHYVSQFDGMCKAAIVVDVDKDGRRSLAVFASEGHVTPALDVPRNEVFDRNWPTGSYHTYSH